jgi:ribosomal-protein-serine acetyltransferase
MLSIPPRSEIRARPLEAQRILLSPIDPSDASELWSVVDGSRAWLEPWLPWVPFQRSAESSLRFAEASAAEWDAGRAVRMVIRERNSGRMLGVVGLENCVGMHRACELGYWLRKEAAGKGLMTEAAKRCVDFGFGALRAHRIRAAAATDNHTSLRVIQRLGLRFEGVARHAEWVAGRWLDHAVYAVLEHEWSDGAKRGG